MYTDIINDPDFNKLIKISFLKNLCNRALESICNDTKSIYYLSLIEIEGITYLKNFKNQLNKCFYTNTGIRNILIAYHLYSLFYGSDIYITVILPKNVKDYLINDCSKICVNSSKEIPNIINYWQMFIKQKEPLYKEQYVETTLFPDKKVFSNKYSFTSSNLNDSLTYLNKKFPSFTSSNDYFKDYLKCSNQLIDAKLEIKRLQQEIKIANNTITNLSQSNLKMTQSLENLELSP